MNKNLNVSTLFLSVAGLFVATNLASASPSYEVIDCPQGIIYFISGGQSERSGYSIKTSAKVTANEGNEYTVTLKLENGTEVKYAPLARSIYNVGGFPDGWDRVTYSGPTNLQRHEQTTIDLGSSAEDLSAKEFKLSGNIEIPGEGGGSAELQCRGIL